MTVLKSFLTIIVALVWMVDGASGAVIVDQQQPLITGERPSAVGGPAEQKLAQTFKVGIDGSLIGLRLPIGCSGSDGELVLRIRRLDAGQPTGHVLSFTRFRGASYPTGASGFKDFFLGAPLAVRAGDLLAYTVRETGTDSSCSYARSPEGDSYADGTGFFDARPNPPGWIRFFGPARDLAFFTLMADPSGAGAGPGTGNCLVPDFTNPVTGNPMELPISRSLPVCRCLEDGGARELRCGILHPDFVLVRRLPIPLQLGEPFTELWEFTPIAELDGPVRFEVKGDGQAKPQKFELGRKGKGSTPETVKLQRNAPATPSDLWGFAVIEYDMKDAQSELLRKFGIDASIKSSRFEK